MHSCTLICYQDREQCPPRAESLHAVRLIRLLSLTHDHHLLEARADLLVIARLYGSAIRHLHACEDISHSSDMAAHIRRHLTGPAAAATVR